MIRRHGLEKKGLRVNLSKTRLTAEGERHNFKENCAVCSKRVGST